jgi:hypothetical protein
MRKTELLLLLLLLLMMMMMIVIVVERITMCLDLNRWIWGYGEAVQARLR